MFTYKLDLEGLPEVKFAMDQRARRIENAVDTIIKKALMLVERHAKILSPVKTGRMRASIGGGNFDGGSFAAGEGIEYGKNYGTIMPTVDYAPFVHRRVPFMTGGLFAAETEINDMAKNEIAKAIQ